MPLESKAPNEYEKIKSRSRDASERRSREGREIGELPPVKRPERRVKSEFDLTSYLLQYFPKKYPKPFGEHHKKYIAELEQKILTGGYQAIGMPRGSGKTTIEKGAVHWALAYGHRNFMIIVAASVDEAKSFLDEIKEMCISDIFSEDFPEIAIPLQKCRLSGRTTAGQTYRGEPTKITIDKTRLKLPTDGRRNLSDGRRNAAI
jgi:hypothetical protein